MASDEYSEADLSVGIRQTVTDCIDTSLRLYGGAMRGIYVWRDSVTSKRRISSVGRTGGFVVCLLSLTLVLATGAVADARASSSAQASPFGLGLGSAAFNPLTYDYAANTGPRGSTTLTTASITPSKWQHTATATISGHRLSDHDIIAEDGYVGTISGNVIEGHGQIQVWSNDGIAPTISYNRIDSSAPPSLQGIGGGAYSAFSNHISSWGDAIGSPQNGSPASKNMQPFSDIPKGALVIRRNWLDGHGSDPDNIHQDGVQLVSGSHYWIGENWIRGYTDSAVIVKSDIQPVDHSGTPITDVTITSNYFGPPGSEDYYFLYVMAGNAPGAAGGRPQMVTITNNDFDTTSVTAHGDRRYVIATGSSPSTQAVFVKNEAQRKAGIAYQQAHPSVLTDNHGPRGAYATDARDARTWIVWSGNRWVTPAKPSFVTPTATSWSIGAEIAPPGGWYDGP